MLNLFSFTKKIGSLGCLCFLLIWVLIFLFVLVVFKFPFRCDLFICGITVVDVCECVIKMLCIYVIFYFVFTTWVVTNFYHDVNFMLAFFWIYPPMSC